MRWRNYINLYEMSQGEAAAIFKRFGVNVRGMDPAAIKKAYRDLIGKAHPDKGGNVEDAKSINAAFDVLKKETGRLDQPDDFQWQSTAGARHQQRQQNAPPREGPAVWAQAGHSGGMPNSDSIYRPDYTDINYIKREMWLKSGKSKLAFTIWGYDGAFFRGTVTVYGSKEIFDEMAKAMITWQTKGGNPYQCRAVFITRGSRMWLAYADGRFYADTHPMEHDSPNQNPGNDQKFVHALPAYLDKLRDGG